MLIITISVEHLCKIAVLFIYATKLAVLCHRHVHAWCYWFSVDFFMMLNDDKVTKRRKAWVSNIISFKTMKNLNIKNRWMTLSGWFILFIYLFLPTIRLILLVERIGEMEKNNEGWDLVNRYPLTCLGTSLQFLTNSGAQSIPNNREISCLCCFQLRGQMEIWESSYNLSIIITLEVITEYQPVHPSRRFFLR